MKNFLMYMKFSYKTFIEEPTVNNESNVNKYKK